MVEDNKPKFELIDSLDPIETERNDYFVSKQKIIQPSGSFSEHIVVKKQPKNADGSPQGNSKQLFIPVSDSVEILGEALKFSNNE